MCEERTHLDVSVDEALLVQELDAEDHLREKYLRLGLAEACAITLDAMREVEEELASAQELRDNEDVPLGLEWGEGRIARARRQAGLGRQQ